MITKTYLDGKLRSLEERLERRIDMKDNRLFREIEVDIANLKNSVKALEEKFNENRDIIGGCFESYDDIKRELGELKSKINDVEKKPDFESNRNSNDEIVSDF